MPPRWKNVNFYELLQDIVKKVLARYKTPERVQAMRSEFKYVKSTFRSWLLTIKDSSSKSVFKSYLHLCLNVNTEYLIRGMGNLTKSDK